MCKAFGSFKFFIEGRVMRMRGQRALMGLCSHYWTKPLHYQGSVDVQKSSWFHPGLR